MQSHPLGVRELKPITVGCLQLGIQSHPLGVRELKLVDGLNLHESNAVAPFRGA